ncbi:MAG: hypothetical protein RIS64_3276 [Bacteroidota bacterium]|jgi:uncharacterized protein (TIGR02646 family)
MRYIDKSNRCQQFDDFVETYRGRLRNDWEKFKKVKGGSEIRLLLHQHLWLHQKGLCAYCEQEIPEKTKPDEDAKSHFEHIRPKKRFPTLTYEFKNLIVSCEGFDLSTIVDKKRQFCGHFKDNDFDKYREDIFLNPTENQAITSYFRFDSEGRIEPNPLKTMAEQKQARYMIETLGLDNPVLNEMRKNQYDFWLEKQMEWSNEQLLAELDEKQPLLPAFHSLLKQKIL